MTEASIEAYHWIEPHKPTMNWRILRVVAIRHEVTCKGLEGALGGKHETISGRITTLEEMGLLDSRTHELPNDRLRSFYRLSSLGAALMDEPTAAEILADLTKLHSQEERDRAERWREIKRREKAALQGRMRAALAGMLDKQAVLI